MQERESNVKGKKEACQKSTEAYGQTVSEIEERLKSATAQSLQTKESIEREALKERARILEEITVECRDQVERAKKQLEKQMKSLKKKLDSETALLAGRIEQKLLN